jgi:hypothetical protein
MYEEVIAMDERTPPEVLDKMSNALSASVRGLVASNPNTPIEALETLSANHDWYVRMCVAKNVNIPVHIVAKLAKDENWSVRRELAENPKMSVELLLEMIDDVDESVAFTATKNPRIPGEVLSWLVCQASQVGGRYGGLNTLYAVARNPSAPVETLEFLAICEDSGIRHWVSENPNTPEIVKLWLKMGGYAGMSLAEFMAATREV